MSVLYNITDKDGNVMTVRIGRLYSTDEYAYEWKPITPGKVKAATGKWHPAYRTYAGEDKTNALACFVKQEDQKIRVMFLRNFFTAGFFFADSGKGTLYEEGVTNLVPGDCTYECLE